MKDMSRALNVTLERANTILSDVSQTLSLSASQLLLNIAAYADTLFQGTRAVAYCFITPVR